MRVGPARSAPGHPADKHPTIAAMSTPFTEDADGYRGQKVPGAYPEEERIDVASGGKRLGSGGCRRSVPDGPDKSNGVELTNRSLQTAEYHHLHGDRSADHNLGTGPRGAGLTLPSRHFANSIRVDVAAFLNQPLKCGFGIDLGAKGADRDPPTTVGMPSLKRKAPEFVRAHGVLTPHPCSEEFLATSTHDKSLALSKTWVPADIASVTVR